VGEPAPGDDRVVTATRAWVERAVIGLNLCPFARAASARGQIRYAVSGATNTDILVEDLESELRLLSVTDAAHVDTTLLIHPFVLGDFLDYNDFLDVADAVVERMGLTGVIQVASFHPRYQFAGAPPGDITNYTNRSPYPILHLLREASVDAAVAAFPDAARIHEQNIDTMQRLGIDGWIALGLPA
jgi:hypothetical protein